MKGRKQVDFEFFYIYAVNIIENIAGPYTLIDLTLTETDLIGSVKNEVGSKGHALH